MDAQVDISVDSATATGVGETLARAVSLFSGTFERLQPNLVLILGDRLKCWGWH